MTNSNNVRLVNTSGALNNNNANNSNGVAPDCALRQHKVDLRVEIRAYTQGTYILSPKGRMVNVDVIYL